MTDLRAWARSERDRDVAIGWDDLPDEHCRALALDPRPELTDHVLRALGETQLATALERLSRRAAEIMNERPAVPAGALKRWAGGGNRR
jgi:hypothetical protein